MKKILLIALIFGGFIVSGGLAHAAIKFVQGTSVYNGGSSNTTSFSSPTVTGNAITVMIQQFYNATFTVSDSQNNVYTLVNKCYNATMDTTQSIYIAKNIAGGADTITVTGNGSDMGFSAHEYSGLNNTTDYFDNANCSFNNSGTSITSDALTTSNSNDLLLAIVGEEAQSLSYSAGPGYTLRTLQSSHVMMTEDNIVYGTGSYKATASSSVVNSELINFVAIKAAPTWYGSLGSWGKRIKISTSNATTSETETDFPVLVQLNSSRVNYSDFNASGTDIRFVSSDNTTVLPYELEKWDTTATSTLWVQIPTLATSTYFYMYYNNPGATTSTASSSAVWDPNFVGVWHMSQTSSPILDSTNNGVNLVVSSTVNYATSSFIDGGYYNNGASGNGAWATSTNAVEPKDQMAISAWVNYAYTGRETIVHKSNNDSASQGGYQFDIADAQGCAGTDFAFEINSGVNNCNANDQATSTRPSEKVWHYVAGTYSSSTNLSLYLDGVRVSTSKGTPSSSIANNNLPFYVSSLLTTRTDEFNGVIDELRLSSTTRSAAWIYDEYVSGLDTMDTYNAVETPNPTPKITSINPVSVNASSSQFTITVNGSGFVTSSTINWDYSGLTTTYVSPSQLTAVIPAANITSPGIIPIQVYNPSPGDGTSNIFYFTINNPTGWFDNAWGKRIKITTADATTTEIETDFPVLVQLNPSRITYGDFNATGTDIRFVSSDNTTVLPYELESWNTSATSSLWVKAPTLSTSTYFYMYYNNPAATTSTASSSAVWDSNFVGVWHLAENSTSTASTTDSTINQNNGNNFGTATTTGPIGIARNFNGTTDYVNVGTGTVTAITGPITISVWAKTATTSIMDILGAYQSSPTGGYQFSFNNGGVTNARFTYFAIRDWDGPSNSAKSDDQWHYYTVVNPASGGATVRFYVDGVSIGTSSYVSASGYISSIPLYLGALDHYGAINAFNGSLEEIRVSSSTRSAAWIYDEYIADTDTMNNYAAAENVPINPMPTITSVSPVSVNASSSQFTLTVNSSDFKFKNNSTVNWNNSALSTTYVSASELTATVPAADVASATTTSITVVTPSPGGGTSNAIYFTVNDPTGWHSASWSKRIKIQTANATTSENDADFPVLVQLNSSRVNYSDFNASGTDIRFVSSDNTIVLPYELEKWDTTATSTLWVKVPTLATSTYFYMYYNNPAATTSTASSSAVWNSNYVGVWHFSSNGSSLNTQDSSSYNHLVQNFGATATSGQIDGGAFLNGSSAFASSSQDGDFNLHASPFSISVWIQDDTPAGSLSTLFHRIISWYDGVNNIQFGLGVNANSQRDFYILNSAGTASAATNIVPLGMNFAAATFDGTNYKTYLNGAPSTSANAGNIANFTGNNSTVYLGQKGNGTAYASGTIDETEITNSTLSAGWIYNEYVSGLDKISVYNSSENAVPVIAAIDPSSTLAGGPQFVLTVNGYGFVASSTINWNGSSLTTTYVSGSQLTATVSAIDIATASTSLVTIVSPTPGGGTSNSKTFTISAPTGGGGGASGGGTSIFFGGAPPSSGGVSGGTPSANSSQPAGGTPTSSGSTFGGNASGINGNFAPSLFNAAGNFLYYLINLVK